MSKKVFTTALVQDGTILYWKQHLYRLQKDAAFLKIAFPHIALPFALPAKGKYRLRICLYKDQLPDYTLTPYQVPTGAITLLAMPAPVVGRLAKVKSIPREHLRKKAQQYGFSDAVTVNEAGYLLEATYANLYWIDQGVLFTPEPCLDLVFGLAIQRKIREFSKVNMGCFYLKDIPETAEVRVCNSLVDLRVSSIS